ncbi:hypothetical protein EC973_007327 [Apophysomyces ossiformis]|uniref:Pentatricopeptide repeat-containing protein-mitochondrial domain-containing protein n=1 Tax=Apophysomyces ossiformis TaxID=679940 RepID=A0A8H7BPJ4_9FUNG|nr:hypothetical protein EC973_007327 [Apophysomyces ossiformis]
MYGVKGTSTFVNTVARQSVISKQLTVAHAPKSSAYLTSLQPRNVSAGKLSYTTGRAYTQNYQSQHQQQQDQVDPSQKYPLGSFKSSNRRWPLSKLPKPPQARFNHAVSLSEASIPRIESHKDIDARIIEAARASNPKAVVEEFVAGRRSGAAFSAQTYEAVMEAYETLCKDNGSVTSMLKAYDHMLENGITPTSHMYARLIRSLCERESEVNRNVQILRRKMARSGENIPTLGELQGENNLEKAVAFFDKAVQEKLTEDFDVSVYNKLLRGLSIRGNTQDGLYIYEQLEQARNAKPNAMTFAMLMNMFGKAGDMEAVDECFKEYKQVRRVLPHHDASFVYNAFVYAQIDAGYHTRALEFLENDMANDKVAVTIGPYNKLIRTWCQEDKLDTVTNLVERLKTDANLPKPNASTYGILLSAYSRTNELNKAAEAYKTMVQYGLTKEQAGYIVNYMNACVAGEKPDVAFAVAKEICDHGLEVDAATCRAIVLGYNNLGQPQRAVDAYTTLLTTKAKGKYIKSTSAMMDVGSDLVEKVGDLRLALSVLRVMWNYSAPPTYDNTQTLFKLYSQTRQHSESWAEFTKDLPPDAYKLLYDAAFKSLDSVSGFRDRVFLLLEDMRSLGQQPTASLYVRILTRFKKNRDNESVERWTREFDGDAFVGEQTASLGEATNKITADSEIQSGKIIDAAIKRDFQESVRILQTMVQNGSIPSPGAIRDTITEATKHGDLQVAKEIYDLAIEPLTRLEKNIRRRALNSVYNTMLIAYARKNDLEMTNEFYEKIRQLNMAPEADAYASLLSVRAKVATDVSEDALAIYEEAKQHKVRPTLYFYNMVISQLSKCRKIEHVLRLFEEMKDAGITPNSITYGSVISACVRCSSEKRANRYFQDMIAEPNYQPRIGAYNTMMQFYLQKHQNREKALSYYQLSKDYNLKPSGHTYKLLIEAYANIPPYDMVAAHKLLTEMKRHDVQPGPSHYATLIHSYGSLHRDVTSAIAVYNEMKKAGIEADDTVYQAVLGTYIENNDMKSAEELYNEMLQRRPSSAYIENLLIQGYGSKGDLKKAEEIFGRMTDNKKHGGTVREPSTYEAMVKVYVENKQLDKANQIIAMMRSRDFPVKVVDGVATLVTGTTN